MIAGTWIRLLLVATLCLSACAAAQPPVWDKHMDAAIAANRQGRYADAESELQSARQEAERFGPDDPRVSSTLKSLVTIYYSQGRFTEAEPLQRRARAIDEKTLGAKDSSVADTLTNLAALYLRQGRYAEAGRIFERALDEWERAVGPDDPRVASALNVVAEVLRAQGKYADATAKALKNGWLYTGDVGKREADGYYYHLGRRDDMIITGGLNVYPAEVENMIYTYPGVQECIVFAIADAKRGAVIGAAIVPRPGINVNEKEVSAFLRANLANFKVPDKIVVREALPRTSSGKTIRDAEILLAQ